MRDGIMDNTECEPKVHMSDGELVSACMEEIGGGIGGTDGNEDISQALDYFFGRTPGLSGSKAKDPNASRFVSMDVQNGVESTLAEIMPTFVTDNVAHYQPTSEKDEDQAKMESQLVNYLFMEEYNGYTLLQTCIKDALLNKNCTAKAYWDERAEVEYETFEDVPEMALPSVLQPNKENQQVDIVEQVVTEEANTEQAEMMQMAAMADPQAAQVAMQGAQQEVQQAMMDAQAKYTIKIKRTTMVGKPVIEAVPPENVIVSGDHDSPYLYDARFVAHEKVETQSSLIAQGFDPEIVNELSDYSADDVSRNREHTEYDSADRSTRNILVYECFYLIDFDGDGIAERRKVVISSNRLLSNDEWNHVPMVGGVATIVPHKYQGLSLFERLKGIQDTKTPIVRAIVDGTQLSSNPRIGIVTGEVNIDDILTSRTGGMVRLDNPNSIVQIPNPEVPQSSYGMLEYFDTMRSEYGGSAIGTASQAQSISGDTAHGVERVMSAMELSNAMIARSVGETLVRGIFIQMHHLLRENYKGELTAKVDGKWLTSMPSEWVNRTAVSVQIGSSQAERARLAGVLSQVVVSQKEAISMGSTLANEEGVYTAVTDMASLAGIKNPDRYFVDPTSKEGQQANQQKQQQQAQEKQKQEQVQQMMLQAQMKLGEAEYQKSQADMLAERVKLQIAQQKLDYDSEISLLKMQLEREQNQNQDYKDGVKLSVEKEKQDADIALSITELELDAQRDASAQYNENREELQ
ncbi:MAG: hypothetical protein DRJ15_16620 [Bacteroidetes bacterium]|nr:MAG: hypothetical protein DRJ15_16620 [Bacteroidota bacterium]